MRGRFLSCVVATSAAVRSAQWMPPCSRSSRRRLCRMPATSMSMRHTDVQVPHSVQRQRSSLLRTASISPARMSRTMRRGPRYSSRPLGQLDVQVPHW